MKIYYNALSILFCRVCRALVSPATSTATATPMASMAPPIENIIAKLPSSFEMYFFNAHITFPTFPTKNQFIKLINTG